MANLGFILLSPQPALNGAFGVSWGRYDMQEGNYALAFLPVSMSGDGKTQIVQIFSYYNRSLGMIVYAPQMNGTYTIASGTTDMKEGPFAEKFLSVDMMGDGKNQIVQLYDNAGKLGIIVYTPNPANGSYQVGSGTQDIGEGSSFLDFLNVTVGLDNKTHIAQLFGFKGNLGVIRYVPQPDGSYALGAGVTDTGAKPIGFKWLPVKMNGDGVSQIVQLSASVTGKMGWDVLSLQPDGTYKATWSTDTLGIPAAQQNFIAVTGTAGGGTQIVQVEAANSLTGLVVYSPQPDGTYAILSRSPVNSFEGFIPVSTTAGAVGQLAVFYRNRGNLGIDVYSQNALDGTYEVTASTPNTGESFETVALIPVSVRGDGVTQLLQIIPTP